MASEHAGRPMAPISKKHTRNVVAVVAYFVATLCLAAASGNSSTIRDHVSLPLGSLRSVCHAPFGPQELFRLVDDRVVFIWDCHTSRPSLFAFMPYPCLRIP